MTPISSSRPLRVLLLTRTSRPSGVRMAQALVSEGVQLAGIVAERRMRLITGRRRVWATFCYALQQHGYGFLLQKAVEQWRIQIWKTPSIERWASRNKIPCFVVDDHHGAEAREYILALRPDLLVLCNTGRIKPEVYNTAAHGALNLHSSLLPRYAGLDSIFWALFHREREIGFTIHRVAERIDAGDILYQERMPLPLNARLDELGEALMRRGCQAMAWVILDLDHYAIRSRKQELASGSYFSWPAAQQRRWFGLFSGALAEDKPLKILHLITRMVRGGAQENTLATVRALQSRGLDVVLATGPSDGPEGSMEEELRAAGVPWRKFNGLVREPSLWNDVRTWMALTRWMRREKFAIVHTHTSKAGALGRLAAMIAGTPVLVHTPHGHVFGGYFRPLYTRMAIMMERVLAKKTDRIIALTPREKIETLQAGIGREDQFAIIPSGVPQAAFDPDAHSGALLRKRYGIGEEAALIGTVARLAPVKGVEYFIRAFARTVSMHPDARCLIAGDGPDAGKLKALAQTLGVAAKVVFAGHCRNVAEALAAMDIFVLASLNEGMGRAIVQAGLMRKPIVASAVSGIQDLVKHEVNGLLVPPADPEAMAAAIERCLSDQAWAAGLGRHARQDYLESYGEDRMVRDIARLYEDAMKQKGIPLNWLQAVPGTCGLSLKANVGSEAIR